MFNVLFICSYVFKDIIFVNYFEFSFVIGILKSRSLFLNYTNCEIQTESTPAYDYLIEPANIISKFCDGGGVDKRRTAFGIGILATVTN